MSKEYVVRGSYVTSYEVRVTADNSAEAYEIGIDKLRDGNFDDEGSGGWNPHFHVEEAE